LTNTQHEDLGQALALIVKELRAIRVLLTPQYVVSGVTEANAPAALDECASAKSHPSAVAQIAQSGSPPPDLSAASVTGRIHTNIEPRGTRGAGKRGRK
jgi:hypothetical protein